MFSWYCKLHLFFSEKKRRKEEDTQKKNKNKKNRWKWKRGLFALTLHPPTPPPPQSCSQHGCSHQRQPCISEELLRTLQQLASGLHAGAHTSSDGSGGYPRVGPEEPGQTSQHSLLCHRYRQPAPDSAGQPRVSLNSTNLVSCWFAAYTHLD